MTHEMLKEAGIPVAEGDALAALKAAAALGWMQENTTLDIDMGNVATIKALPFGAKLFVVKYCEAMSVRTGVASQSIEGLSQSFTDTTDAATIWKLANTLIGAYLKSQVRVSPAKRRW